MGVSQWDPTQVVITVDGQVLGGFGPETFVEAKFNDNKVKLIRGSEGESTRTMSLDRSGTIHFSLLQTSEGNAILNRYATDDRGSGGAGIFGVMVSDTSGSLKAHGAKAWVEEIPGLSASGSGVKVREWAIAVQVLVLEDIEPNNLFTFLAGLTGAVQNIYQGAEAAIGKAIVGGF